MIIHGISGEEGNRSAIVTFDREQLLLYEGDQDKNKKFKVIRIDEKKITVSHTAALEGKSLVLKISNNGMIQNRSSFNHPT